MKRILFFFATSLFLAGCEKASTPEAGLAGTYVGLFSRTGSDTSQVSLYFDGNRFSGQSNQAHYPAIGAGHFDIDNNNVIFQDTLTWTANFDWSLILTGTYHINYGEGTVRLWKSNGTVTDEYILRQPTR